MPLRMKKTLTHSDLISTAKEFCARNHIYPALFGVTDGKAVGTFIEHEPFVSIWGETTPAYNLE